MLPRDAKITTIMDKDMKCITKSTTFDFRNVFLDPDVNRTAIHSFLETQGPIDDESLNEYYQE